MKAEVGNDESIETAQLKSFAGKLPIFFVALAVVWIGHIALFAGTVAWPFSVAAPGVLSTLLIVEAIRVHRIKYVELSRERTRKLLFELLAFACSIVVIAGVITNVTFAYANDHQKYSIIIQTFAIGMCGSVCVLHVKKVAIFGGIIFFGLNSLLLFGMGDAPSAVAAATVLLVLTVYTKILHSYSTEFDELTKSRSDIFRLSQENARLAALDMLTGVPNRRHFFEALEACKRKVDARGGELAVGMVDLDGFKPINDTYGHRLGDHLLVKVVARLAAIADVSEFCRIGGDEFAFLVVGEGDPERVVAIGQELVEALREPFTIGDVVVSVGCSVGMHLYRDKKEKAEALYEKADFALYFSKKNGGARVSLFSREHQSFIAAQGAIEQALRLADPELEFYPLFQPIVLATAGRVKAFECLARWNSPTLGLVGPGKFIPVAEQCGLISTITTSVLNKALAAMKDWPSDIGLTFNLSAVDVANANTVLHVLALVQNSGVDPDRITFELTETAFLNDFALARKHLDLLKQGNIRVALDDFGTGFSSLSHLQMLPLDKLKIDKRFIDDLESSPTSRNIVRALIALCRDMEIDCVVEGVETESQASAVKALGGDMIQGYHFAKPMARSDIGAYLEAIRAASRSEKGPAPSANLGDLNACQVA